MEDSFKVHVVRLKSDENQQILDTFECLKAEKFNPVWFTEKQCLEIKQKEKNSIFIFEDFVGDAFEHLSNLKFRILGPQCILTSTACKKEIPRGSTPIFNLAMKDLLVCCTSVDIHCRDDIYQKVRWMGGNVTKDFMMGVTHLVAGEVGSKKYQVAADLGLPIMLPTWVNTVWETSRKEAKHIHALDEQFQGLKCPIFCGLVVTVSGLSTDERKEAKKLIEKEGGTYSGEMKMNHTSHLIINEAKGQKYEFAKKWNMCIVRTEWLYDSVEKGYCQKVENYPVDSCTKEPGHKAVKTSTPERASLGGKEIGDISNISAISMMQINETRCNDNTFSSSSTSINYHDPFKGLDLTLAPEGDFFLDSCKIYLSGFQGQAMDKLRKIINAGGATRFSQINENLTHVVIGEKISKDIEQLKGLSTRPHAVIAQWLIDCFKQRQHLNEIDYVSPELPPLNPSSPKLKRDTHLSKPRLTSKGASSELEISKGHSLKDEEKQELEEAAEMESIMSQYLIQPKLMAESGEVTAVENKSAGPEGKVQVEVMEEDMTQDPGQIMEPEGDESSKGIFHNKTFVIYGFEDEAMTELAVFIVDNAGVVIHQNFRQIPDYAVVPIDGFPVERTVKNVVTNAWLQMCVERDMLLPVNGNPLFHPIEIIIEGNPLANCVLSISGIAGVERDCLVHIAELLGATCQEYFVRVARSNFKPSTHLIVNAPEGSKFEAAKKWNIPAVSRDWLFACAKSGRNEPEENYLIENVIHNDAQCMDQSVPSKQTDNQSCTSKERSKCLLNEEANVSVNKQEDGSASKKNVNQGETIQEAHVMEDFTQNEDALLAEIKLDNFSVETSVSVDRTKQNKLSVHEANEKKQDQENVKNRSSIQEQPSDFANHKDQSVTPESRNSGEAMSGTSQKENRTVIKNLKESTPLHNRIKELQVRDADRRPHSPATQARLGIVTPSKFLDPNKRYKPDFDVTEFLKAIETPPEVKAKMKSRRKSSVPLGELIERHLEIMVERSEQMTRQMSQSEMDEVDGSVPYIDKPLRGVVISVSKKLCSKQAEYNDIVSELGGDYMWTYDSTCTHFIFQGKTNDTSKEFKVAKEHKKIIVSPYWLQMCKEQNARVDESLFPYNYNPNLSLSVVKKLETPKSTRRTARLARIERADNHDTKGDHSTENKESKEVEKPIIEPEKMSALAAYHEADNSKADAAASESEMKGSYEIREVLSRQLENIMAASKGTNSGSKRRIKRTNSSGQFNASGETSGSTESRPSSRQIRRTQDDTPKASKRQTRSSGHKPDSNSDTMPSQSLQVVWDDPIGRLEKEKLAHKLERVCSPTQEVDSLAEALDIPPDAQYSDDEEDMDITVPQILGPGHVETNDQKDEPHRTPTPEAPSLDFPMPKTHKEVTPPKPVEPMKEEKKKPKMPPVFLFSGISPEERMAYGALIEQMGGKVLDCVNFDPICTHLIVGTPARNEKFLACVASGKWVLHKSYLEACREQNRFIQEDLYEWGGEGTMSLLSDQNSKEAKLAMAAHHWRVKIQEARQVMSTTYGAFQNWKVILCLGNGKEANFRRLLEAGGATVFNKRPPFTKDIDATHVFIELNTANLSQVDLEHLAASAAICVRPEFIPAQLMDIPAPDPNEYSLSQILVLRKNLQKEKPPSRKRRNTPASEESGKLKRTRQR
ncbi:hypothetical protein CHS0354_005324 [Potamilus streckersoni]|uniref:BRCT domain-containing protein n=1 Tax=Potamilus streckersoni TaxID=2493646 RepID=A0AAE0SGD6_9BIVA|nr:hypothetical protein CHS0354_005324 [Potamilus streckersoni]